MAPAIQKEGQAMKNMLLKSRKNNQQEKLAYDKPDRNYTKKQETGQLTIRR
jgi:hypothetical protein